MTDILFHTPEYVFSYRVAGICVRGGRVLLQKAPGDDGYAFPGGHVAFGETNAETLTREFYEEIGARVAIGGLRWVGEIFFNWGGTPCHQICNYYDITLADGIPTEGVFPAHEHIEGRKFTHHADDIEFHWIELVRLHEIAVYPPQAAEFLADGGNGGVRHFVYRE